MDEFDTVCTNIGRLNRFKSDLDEKCAAVVAQAADAQVVLDGFETNKQAVIDEIAQLESDKETAESDAEEAQGNLTELESNLTAKRSEESDVVGRIEQLEDGIDQKKKESQGLNTEIVECKTELKSLKENINLFPSEISGFVSQGAKNIRVYVVAAAIPIAVLVAYAIVILTNAADLAVVYKLGADADLLTMFLSRLPFALISAAVFTVCYKLAKTFILDVMRINRERLALSQVSIIAKDVSDAMRTGLGFKDDEVYELRTKLKMGMLKSHLKGLVDNDYDYDLEFGLWERLKRFRKQQAQDAEEEDDKE